MKKNIDVITPDIATIAEFRDRVWARYHANPRPLPWRETFDPYSILVSEVMLQQTGVERVIPKYRQFLDLFPDVAALARADLHAVLSAWQGLGYNRRGAALKRAAEEITARHGGQVPDDAHLLATLPGIGPYTAAAVVVFSWNRPQIVIETNIRTVFIHEFFADRSDPIHDRELAPIVAATMDADNPRDWYYALMDYGVALKKSVANPSRRSAQYAKQSRFTGSTREMRSRLLREVLEQPGRTVVEIAAAAGIDAAEAELLVRRMEEEGLLQVREKRVYV